MNVVLVAIASISLLVGGIGIMNIMYVTVSEKTKEVGIRRAIGARKSDILFQFLIEAVALSIIGGALGLGLAFITITIVHNFFPAYIDLPSVILALGVSSGIGIIFGVLPARKAADLEPVEAIRYE
jgi:putative ABC transport system permease protein